MNHNQVMPTDPQQLRSEASMREFRLRKLVQMTQIWPELTIEQFNAAKEIAAAEQKVSDAKNELATVKRDIFNQSHRW